MTINENNISRFNEFLLNEEKSKSTISKYIKEVKSYANWLGERAADKTAALTYKASLLETLSAKSVNVVVAALNCFFRFMNMPECELKSEKIQAQTFMPEDRELTQAEYKRLLNAAKQNERLFYMIRTIAGTGIRVSELRYITVEAVEKREAVIACKGKTRIILIDSRLCRELKKYIKHRKIKSGAIFVTRTGKPVDRTNVWREMKALCKKCGVSEEKVFPHNLRHFFARMFYAVEKNLVKLANVLGHSSINTTRIYILESSNEHRKLLRKMKMFYEEIQLAT